MTGKVWKLVAAASILLSSSVYAHEIKSFQHIKINPDGSQTLLNHVPREVARGLAHRMAHAKASQKLDLRIILPSKDPAGLDNFIKELYDPKSPNYHKFITPDQFALMYGASSTDSSIVSQYLQSHGMKVRSRSKSGIVMTVTGQVSTVEPAFGVSINNYQKTDGTAFFAPDADPTIPPQVAGKIDAIVGMDNVTHFYPHFHKSAGQMGRLSPKSPAPVTPAPAAPVLAFRGSNGIITAPTVGSNAQITAALAPAFTGFGGSIGPTDIATAYNYNSVASTGSGQTLALYELDGYHSSDITTFESFYSLPNMTLTNVINTTDGATGTPGSNTDEVVLDIELAIAVAPGLSSIIVYESTDSGTGWIDQWQKIATDNLAKVISCSWGGTEAGTFLFYDHTVFSQLAAQGQSVLASSGDAGAYDNCDGGTLPPSCTSGGSPATGVLSVDDPASDPNVTGVGISAVTVNGSGAYVSETASLYGGGGVSGFSSSGTPHAVAIPSYQATAAAGAASGSQVSTTNRNVPDVSFTADPSTIYGIYVTDPSSGVGWYGFWGSSASTPIWASFISRVNQGRVAAGQSVIGFLNPVLYQVAASSRYTNDFHDVTTGNNSFYPAKAGYDDATGLGSFNGANLYSDLIGPAAPTVTPTAGNAQVVLNWTASTGAGSYNVKRATVSGGPYTTISTSGAVTSTNYTDTSLTNGTTYYYVVSAVNSATIEGLNSVQASVVPVTVPSAPTTVTAVAGNAQAAVTFSGAVANGSAITGYTVTSSPGGFSATGASSPITVTGLTNGTAYTFTVTATNAVGTGSASSASNSVTPFGLPGAPTSVSAVAGHTQATVTFSGAPANGSAITGYTVTSSPGSFTGTGASSPITVTGLTDGTAYTFTVTATNGVGTSSASSASNSVTPNIVPAAPTGVSATAGNTQATVSFSAPSPNGGTAVLSYTVTSSPGSFTATGASSPITVTGLTNGTAYTFTVVAVNATGPGTVSSASNSVTPAGAPTAPTSVSAAAGNTQATVTFSGASANGSSITGYTVTSSPGGFTGTGASSPITVTGLTNGTAYTFTVTATNGVGTSSASSSSNSVTPAGAPVAPTSVSAAAGNAQATVTFSGASANGSAITGYTVTSSPGSFTATGASSPITVTGLTNGTAYTFTVTATNAVGTSSASSASNSVTPLGLPGAPTSISAVAGNTQATVTFSGASANGSAITGYTVTSSPGGLTGTGASSPITVTGLTNGTAYTFTVTATNGVGTSSASSASNSATPAGVPIAPTSVTAAAGNTQAVVTFSGASANGSAITGYTVTSSPGGFTGTGASSPITVTGLTNGTAYTFAVTATNGVGTSSASSASNSVTPNIVPAAPTGVSATAGNTQATVSFSAPSPNGGTAVLSYTVTSSPGSFTATGASSPITVTGLTNGTAYTFTVVAVNATGPGTASSASNSVTPAGAPTAPTTVTAVRGDTQAAVTFSGASANGSAITSYTVTSSPGSFTATGATSPITVTGLTNGTAYTFTVTATNGVGTSSASSASNSVTPAGAPVAPTSVTAVAGSTQAVVTFSGASANGTAITGYTVTSSPGGFTATGASSPITVTGLTNGTAYTFTVTATNGVGTGSASSASNSATPAGVPVAPTTVTAVRGDTQATVTFSGALANGSAITGYTVTSSPGGFTATGASSPITVTGLTNGTAYTFTVTATNGIGTSSASLASNSVTPAGLPAAPTSLSATAGNTQATVTFSGASANGSAITVYTVTSSPGGFTGTGASSPITVTGLTNGTAYTFTVTATNGVGTSSASSSSNSITPNIVPGAPTSVSAVRGDTQAAVSFSAPAPNGGTAVLSYTVTSSPGGFTATGASSPITVTGLTNGTSYTFTVVAVNATGPGTASSASNSVTPAGIPVAPTSVAAAAGNTQATITFSGASANGNAITSYTVTSSPGSFTATGATSPITVTGLTNGTAYTFTVTVTNGIGTSSASTASNSITPAGLPTAPTSVTAVRGDTQAVISFSGALANGSVISGYTVTSSPGGFTGTGASSPITVAGLTNGTAYTFTVTATNGIGTSTSSLASNSVTPAGAPVAPTTVTAVSGNTQAAVSFSGASANGSAITGYTVTSSPGGFSGTGASSPITVTGLTNGTTYTFTVTATNGVGTSSSSLASNGVIPGLPFAPTTVTAAVGDTQAVVTFSGAFDNGIAITGYTVTSSPGGFTGTGASSPITVAGLTNGTAYTFTVTATNSIGTSSASAASNSVIPAGVPVAPTTVTATAGDTQAVVAFSGALANGRTITAYTVTSSPGGFTGTGASSPVTVAGLTNGTAYTFTVTATNSIGTSSASAASNSVMPAGVPIAPTTVSATGGDAQAVVSFSGALDNGNAITGYIVTSSPGGITASGASSPLVISGLTNGTSYTFTVRAVNGMGTGSASAASNSVIPAGVPIAPTTVTVVGGDTQATVSFSGASANGSAITVYTVTSSPGGITVTGTSSPIVVTGLTNGIVYTFTVTASNTLGTSTASAVSNSVTPSPVAPPSGLSIVKLGARIGGKIISAGASLTWAQSATPGILQNKIYRSTGGGSYLPLATVDASTAYIDKSVAAGTSYRYEITAFDSNGNESIPSDPAAVNY